MRLKLATAQRYAERVVSELAPFCDRIEVAGSIRRLRPEVNDLDIVCISQDRQGLHKRLHQSCAHEKSGECYSLYRMSNGFQIDLWEAHEETKDLLGEVVPSNWGTLLMCRTGSAQHNMRLAEYAKRKGLHWNPHAGLIAREGLSPSSKIVAGATEEGIYQKLGWQWLPPEKRDLVAIY